jgi:hypothetical protein
MGFMPMSLWEQSKGSFSMDLFSVANRCPKCRGDASAKYHQLGLNCLQMNGPLMHRKCEDCGFSWGERPSKQLTRSG